MFNRRKKSIQVWNNLKVSIWWPNLHFWVNCLFKTLDWIDGIHMDKFSYVRHKCTLSTGSNWDCNEIDWKEIVALHLIIIWLLPAIHCLIFQWRALVSLWTLCTLPPNLLRLMYSAHSGTLSFRGHGNLWFAHSKSIKSLKGKDFSCVPNWCSMAGCVISRTEVFSAWIYLNFLLKILHGWDVIKEG